MTTKKLLGARFRKMIDDDFDQFQISIHYDYKLAEYDIYHSIIYTKALTNSGILTSFDSKKIISALNLQRS